MAFHPSVLLPGCPARKKQGESMRKVWTRPGYRDEVRKKISAAKKGKPSHFKGLTYEEIYGERAKEQATRRVATMLKRLHGPEGEMLRERRRKAVNPASFGNRNKRIHYLSRSGNLYKMPSSWEVKFAEALDKAQLTWFYEPTKILLSDGRTYIPDFFVVEWNEYVELKGWEGWGLDKAIMAVEDGHRVRIAHGDKAFLALLEEVRV